MRLAAAATLRQAIHAPITKTEQRRHEKTVATAQSALSAAAFNRAWQAGVTRPLEQHLALIPAL